MLKAICALVMGISTFAFAAGTEFPSTPDPRLTPGSYCKSPDGHRYPERIPYCERQVSKGTKWKVIETYNRELNYDIDRGNRAQFKIDHMIPLCAGGSNEVSNLWPQHQTIYEITDPLEGIACEKMAAGRLQQKRAVELLVRAKLVLEEAPAILEILESL